MSMALIARCNSAALDLAGRLRLPDPVIEADRLLVYRVLLRDRAAIADLVGAVLGPLQGARGGAEPLLATLQAYFAARGVSALAARRLHVGVRTVAYRLHRVKQLTAHAVTDPVQRFTLEAAVLGARLLDWPRQPLPSTVDPPAGPAATPPTQPVSPDWACDVVPKPGRHHLRGDQQSHDFP
jgi:DNA-binding PucR family transcriptional regulator